MYIAYSMCCLTIYLMPIPRNESSGKPEYEQQCCSSTKHIHWNVNVWPICPYDQFVSHGPPIYMSSPFAPITMRNTVGYNVVRDNASSSDSATNYSSKWTARGKGKGKPSKKGKRSNDPNDRFWTIPEFGKVSGDARIVVFSMTQFSESINTYRKNLPQALERSNLPGYVVQRPELSFIAARKRPDQIADQDLGFAYHQALKALYQLCDSSRLYLIEDRRWEQDNQEYPAYAHLVHKWATRVRSRTRKPEAISGRLLESPTASAPGWVLPRLAIWSQHHSWY